MAPEIPMWAALEPTDNEAWDVAAEALRAGIVIGRILGMKPSTVSWHSIAQEVWELVEERNSHGLCVGESR